MDILIQERREEIDEGYTNSDIKLNKTHQAQFKHTKSEKKLVQKFKAKNIGIGIAKTSSLKPLKQTKYYESSSERSL